MRSMEFSLLGGEDGNISRNMGSSLVIVFIKSIVNIHLEMNS